MKKAKNELTVALTLVAILALLPTLPSMAAPWTPIRCEDRAAEVRQLREGARLPPLAVAFPEYAQSVRSSQPGDPRYVPHPFPRTDDHIAENFKYAMTQRLFHAEKKLTPQEAAFREALQQDEYELRVDRMVNWLPSQCSGAHRMDHLFLVRAYDGGTEVGRGALHLTGILGQFAFTESERSAFVELDDLERSLAAFPDLDLHPQASQYVITGGFPYRCTPVKPCIAFKSRGDRYVLVHHGLLYKIPGSGPHLSVDGFIQLVRSKPLLTMNRDRPDHPWVSVGYGWRQVLLVGGRLTERSD